MLNICIYCIVQEELEKVVDKLNICIYCIVQEELEKVVNKLNICIYCIVQEELEKAVDKLNICIYCIIVQVNQEELEKIVDKLKMVQDEKKKEARKVLTVTSTALNSPASQPSSPHRQVVLSSRGLIKEIYFIEKSPPLFSMK